MAHWCEIQGSENLSDIKDLQRSTATNTHTSSSDQEQGFAEGTPTSIKPIFFSGTERQTSDGMAISNLITSPPALLWHFVTKITGRPKCLSSHSAVPLAVMSAAAAASSGKLQPRPPGLVSVEAANKGGRARSRPIYFYREEGEVNQSLCSRFSFNSFLIISTTSSGKNETGLKKMMSLRKHLTNFSSDEDLI